MCTTLFNSTANIIQMQALRWVWLEHHTFQLFDTFFKYQFFYFFDDFVVCSITSSYSTLAAANRRIATFYSIHLRCTSCVRNTKNSFEIQLQFLIESLRCVRAFVCVFFSRSLLTNSFDATFHCALCRFIFIFFGFRNFQFSFAFKS